MTKTEFLKRWAKKATGGGAVEAFENDLEKFAQSLVVCSSSAIVNGLLKAIKTLPKQEQELFRKMVAQVSPAVRMALTKLYQ